MQCSIAWRGNASDDSRSTLGNSRGPRSNSAHILGFLAVLYIVGLCHLQCIVQSAY